MSEFKIHIPARKKQTITEKDAAVKVTGKAYNALSMRQIASLLILEGSKHIVYDKEEE